MCAEDDDLSSPFSRLPNELLLQIFNKLQRDLKTLCICKSVSERFYFIVIQIDSVLLTVSSGYDINSCNDALFDSRREFFLVARKSIWNFLRLKSLHIHLPFRGLPSINFKWKVQVSNRVDSFVFLSPNSIHTTNTNTLLTGVNENEEEEDEGVTPEKFDIALNCYKDAFSRLMMLSQTYDFRLLEYVSITDSGKWGTICFISGEKISKVWDLIRSVDARQRLNLLKSPNRIGCCYIQLLKLPVSGYLMKGVTIVAAVRDDLADDNVINDNVDVDKEDGTEQDKEEAAYREAMIEIFKKHRGSLEWDLFDSIV